MRDRLRRLDLRVLLLAVLAGLLVAFLVAAFTELRHRQRVARETCQQAGYATGEYSARTNWQIVCREGE